MTSSGSSPNPEERLYKNFDPEMDYHFSTGWMPSILMLRANLERTDPIRRKIREAVYEGVRESSGLTFAGFGDDPDRWIKWMKENQPPRKEEPYTEDYTAIAWDGKNRYLLQRNDSFPNGSRTHLSPRGCVLNAETAQQGTTLNVSTILADGQWYPISVDPAQVKEWMRQVTEAIL